MFEKIKKSDKLINRIVIKKIKLGMKVKKILFLLSLFCGLSMVEISASSVVPYSKENKVYKEMHKSQTYMSEYEKGGSNYLKKYENDTDSIFSKEGYADGDIIPCWDGEGNIAARNGNSREFHDIYGKVGDTTIAYSHSGHKTPFDMTSINSFDEINKKYVDKFRSNGDNLRYCHSKKLKNGGNGEYDVDKIYCEAGMETTVFLGDVEDPYTGKVPSCKLVLDTNVKIDEVRYLRQIIAPDNTSGSSEDNYSMGNGLVKCTVKADGLYLEMLENPVKTTTCDKTNYNTFDGGRGCCNPITGFGCNAEYCQYGADKHCKGETIQDVGSCKFESKIITFVKGVTTVESANGVGSATFKCQENGSWLKLSSSGC